MKKLFLITLLAVTSAAPIFATAVPDEEEIKSLADRTLLAWNKGVLKKDFTAFSKNEVASAVQDQLTPEKLLNNFKEAVDKGLDISSAVKEMEPEFKPEPSISHVGNFEVLTVKGFYDTKPNRLNFQLKYIEQDDEWKLVGIDVVIKPQD